MDAKFPTIIKENRTYVDFGGGLTWFFCIVLAVLLIHFTCAAGTATGYLGEVCLRGMNIWDFLGILCCAPVYLLFIILASGGLRIW